MNKERLLRLADFLEREVPENRFDLAKWSNGDLSLCGTTACACGWATTIPEFAEAGLKLERYEHKLDDGEVLISRDIVFGEFTSFDAVTEFFDLPDHKDSSYLFYVDRYPNGERTTKHDVVERIRQFVEGKA
jgi:hypothetical protein